MRKHSPNSNFLAKSQHIRMMDEKRRTSRKEIADVSQLQNDGPTGNFIHTSNHAVNIRITNVKEKPGNVNTVKRKRSTKEWIKPGISDGSQPLETFLSAFNSAADYNQWDEMDKLAHLKACLRDNAANVLWDTDSSETDTLDKLLKVMHARYGNTGHKERFQTKLRSFKQCKSI